VRDTARRNDYFETLQPVLSRKQIAPWMELNAGALSGRIARIPARDELDISVNEALIVEFYSR
jgi:small subunit ribosomal protein S4